MVDNVMYVFSYYPTVNIISHLLKRGLKENYSHNDSYPLLTLHGNFSK